MRPHRPPVPPHTATTTWLALGVPSCTPPSVRGTVGHACCTAALSPLCDPRLFHHAVGFSRRRTTGACVRARVAVCMPWRLSHTCVCRSPTGRDASTRVVGVSTSRTTSRTQRSGSARRSAAWAISASGMSGRLGCCSVTSESRVLVVREHSTTVLQTHAHHMRHDQLKSERWRRLLPPCIRIYRKQQRHCRRGSDSEATKRKGADEIAPTSNVLSQLSYGKYRPRRRDSNPRPRS